MSDTATQTDPQVQAFAEAFGRVAANVEQVIRGKSDVVRLTLVALFAEGHLLLEDVPGVGKTMLARSIAASLDGTWRRIQFTPDLLPSDVTGVSIFDQKTNEFEFHEGPIFANLVLADEINRASPKTQSALLQVMEERHATIDGDPKYVPRPFLVIATQNPIELEGTYRLPEAQLDRFMMKASLGHPDVQTEVEILKSRGGGGGSADQLSPVMSVEEYGQLVQWAQGVHVSEGILHYVANITDGTRRLPELRLGASPRGSLSLLRAARVLAASEQRNFVKPDDVGFLAEPVLAHRLILTPEAELQGRTGAELIQRVVSSVPVPPQRF